MGLNKVQAIKNRRYHRGIKRTPFEALFGCEMRIGTENDAEESLSDSENLVETVNYLKL